MDQFQIAMQELRKRLDAKNAKIKLLTASIGRKQDNVGVWIVTLELPSGAITTVSAETGKDHVYSERALDDVAHRIHRHVTRPAPEAGPAVLPETEKS